MSEVANNIEATAASQEKFGLMEALSANIKKITSFVKRSIKKVFDLGVDTTKQLLDWIIPDSPVKDIAKSMIQKEPTDKEQIESSAPTQTEAKKSKKTPEPRAETTSEAEAAPESNDQQQAA